MTSCTGETHILVVPYPAQGHLIPLLDLTHHLLLRGVTATVVVTPNNRPLLQPLLSGHPAASVSTLVLPFPSHPSLPAGVENIQDLPPDSTIPVMTALSRLREPIKKWFADHPSPPSVIVSDMFLGWTHGLAEQLGVKRVVFSPSGALAISVMHWLWKHVPELPADENAVVSFDGIPGKPCFESYEVSGFYKSYKAGVPGTRFFKDQFMDNMASWGFVFNTFTDLERDYLAHIMIDLGHDRVWAVGPVSELGVRPIFGDGSDSKVLSWLDKCGDAKVVYVSFGSEAVLTNEQMEALAVGLERSGVHFVWIVKSPNNGHVDGERFGKLPRGFEDRLSAGVMMLAWPLGADQYSDAVLLVDNLKIGVRVGRGTKSLPDPDELGRILAGSVSGACKEHHLRALELKKMAKEAVSEGGSSLRELDGFVKDLCRLPKPGKNTSCESFL
ncbi:hypothetical protein V2J09_020432 [Rumex salicifolius]